jgi:ergothioneine biosynthesis protein EgtB
VTSGRHVDPHGAGPSPLPAPAAPLPPVVPDAVRRGWAASDSLFDAICTEAMGARAIPLRHPAVFYLGHLPAFAWAQVGRGLLGLPPVDPELDPLFERGIDPEPGASPLERPTMPGVERAVRYRDAVRVRLAEVAGRVAASRDPLAPWIWDVVVEHERMHHETLLYLIAELDPSQLRPPVGSMVAVAGPAARAASWSPVPSGPAWIGSSLEDGFGWDNEHPRATVHVAPFELRDLPSTNGDFLAFVEGGGYRTRSLWTDVGWAWRAASGLELPPAWRRVGGEIEVRSAFAWHPLAEAAGWPVRLSCAEAEAYARWAGARLPTEAEIARARWGDRPATPEARAPSDLRAASTEAVSGLPRWSERPVGSDPRAGPFGHRDLVGGLWCWTSTRFEGLPGFKPWIRTYPAYSADFFDGEHRVVAGGSWATHARLERRGFRNWYRWNYKYAFVGVRLAR